MAIRRRPLTKARGFTLIEILIAASIIGILATIGAPMYVSALRTARVQKAVAELRVISQAIDIYRTRNDLHLPVSLHQVGFGGRLDPWGVPYCYLNFELGTGDGLEWAVGAGLVDPSAVLKDPGGTTGGTGGGTVGGSTGGGAGTGTGGGAGGVEPGGGEIPTGGGREETGSLTLPILPDRGRWRPAAFQQVASTSLRAQISAVAQHLTVSEVTDLVKSLDGKPLFASVPVATTRRSDRYLFPLNTDYDLFTLGPNGMTATSLGHSLSQDDIIRANDGAFFGMASSY